MFRIGKNLDQYSTKFLSRKQVFLMDLVISVFISVAVAVATFLLDVEVVSDRAFDWVWGFSSAAGSVLMFLLLKTYTIIIRHFSFKDTLLFGLASLGKVLVMTVILLLFGYMRPGVVAMLAVDAIVSLVALCTVRLLMI